MTSTIQFPTYVIGLMSGTSADGVDAALLFTDGREIVAAHESAFVGYDNALRTQILGLMQGIGDEAAIAHALTVKHAEAVATLLRITKIPREKITLIGFHGQTIKHDPANGITQQIGDAALLARETGMAVVADFRTNDVAHGGQGAPLVPLYHAALAAELEKPVMFVNIGGVANVTWIDAQTLEESCVGEAEPQSGRGQRSEGGVSPPSINTLLAFDCGPGNALIDDWVHRHTGARYDKDGALAAVGMRDEAVVAEFLRDPFFAVATPKSLDRNYFNAVIPGLSRDLPPHAETSTASESGASKRKEIPGQARDDSIIINGAATLTAMTAAAIAHACTQVAIRPDKLLICGGGRHNPTLMKMIAEYSGCDVAPVEVLGLDGDMLEAQAFAYLAARSVLGLPLSLPSTTAVRQPVTGGVFYPGGCVAGS